MANDPKSERKSEWPDPRTTMVFETKAWPASQMLPDDMRPMQVEVVGGAMDGHEHQVAGTTFSIGRGPKNDLTLALDPMVSTKHSRIVKEGNHYWLEDLESRNGTFLGDQRITARILIGPGTLFFAGSTCLEFMPR